jgi:hypothetical protein
MSFLYFTYFVDRRGGLMTQFLFHMFLQSKIDFRYKDFVLSFRLQVSSVHFLGLTVDIVV